MKNEYFDIVQAFEGWLNQKLAEYKYHKEEVLQKVNEANYKLTNSEKGR